MQRRPQLSLLALLAALLVPAIAPLPAAAESAASARPWLDKLMALFDKGPFTLRYAADLDLGQMGQPIRGTLEGEVTYGDRQHLRQVMKMKLSGLPGGDGQTPAEMNILSVSDGELTWTEIAMPGGGDPQVMKISRRDAEEPAADQAAVFGAGRTSMDPVAQLEAMSRTMDFELLETTGGRVSLLATASAEDLAQLGQLGALGVDSFLLVLDESTGFPVEMRAGEPRSGQPAVLDVRFDEVKVVDPGDLPQGVFEYSPPEGVAVVDLGAMVGAGSN